VLSADSDEKYSCSVLQVQHLSQQSAVLDPLLIILSFNMRCTRCRGVNLVRVQLADGTSSTGHCNVAGWPSVVEAWPALKDRLSAARASSHEGEIGVQGGFQQVHLPSSKWLLVSSPTSGAIASRSGVESRDARPARPAAFGQRVPCGISPLPPPPASRSQAQTRFGPRSSIHHLAHLCRLSSAAHAKIIDTGTVLLMQYCARPAQISRRNWERTEFHERHVVQESSRAAWGHSRFCWIIEQNRVVL
jgi:hypothetical protein